MAMLVILGFPLTILVLTAISVVAPTFGTSSILNPGPHGLSEILYAFTSGTGNNGSAFGGLTATTKWYNISLAMAMMIGRFFMIIRCWRSPAASAQEARAAVAGTFPVTTPLFSALLVGVIVIVGALTFFPALSLGPIVEHC
jgi:K+-transporting ATPase ATPase A chain